MAFVAFLLLLFFATNARLCTWENLRRYNLVDYGSLLIDAHLILNFEPNHNYLRKNISLECYIQAHRNNDGKSCPELFHNESYNHFFLYAIQERYTSRFRRACKEAYRACFAIENYEHYDRSFFDCHDGQSDIFVYTGSETLIKIEEKHLLKYSSKRTGDAILYKVAPEQILQEKQFLYKVTVTNG